MHVGGRQDRSAVGCIEKPMQEWRRKIKLERLENRAVWRSSSRAVMMTSIRAGEEEQDSVDRHDCREDRDGVGTLWYTGIIGTISFDLKGRGTKEVSIVKISHIIRGQFETTWVCVVS